MTVNAITPDEWTFRYRAGRIVHFVSPDEEYGGRPVAFLADIREFRTIIQAEKYAKQIRAEGGHPAIQCGILRWSDNDTVSRLGEEATQSDSKLI